MSSQPILIYLADDDEDDRMLFAEALNSIGVPSVIHAAEDGNHLTSLLAQHQQIPDLILLDLNMPNKNGRETLRELKQDEKFKDVPMVIYSTSTSEFDIDQAFRDGASMYLEKPYSFPDLVKVLEKLLKYDWDSVRDRRKFFLSSRNSG